MRLAYLTLHLLPTVAVLVLALSVVRAISVRITWRNARGRVLDDETV